MSPPMNEVNETSVKLKYKEDWNEWILFVKGIANSGPVYVWNYIDPEDDFQPFIPIQPTMPLMLDDSATDAEERRYRTRFDYYKEQSRSHLLLYTQLCKVSNFIFISVARNHLTELNGKATL